MQGSARLEGNRQEHGLSVLAMRSAPIISAVALAPLLALSLWFEVIAGTGGAWDELAAGANYARVAIWMLYAAAGPIMVLIATVRTRSRVRPVAARALLIERRALLVAGPLGLFGMLMVAAASVI